MKSLTGAIGSLDTRPRPAMSATSGVVAALRGLAKGMAVDLAPVGVRVNVVGSGAVCISLLFQIKTPLIHGLYRLIQRFGFLEFTCQTQFSVYTNGECTNQIWDHFPSEMKESFNQMVQNSQLIKRLGTPSEV